MRNCLVDVLNVRDTVLHLFPIALENHDGTPRAVDAEQEALKLAAPMQLVPETDLLHARPHVSRGGQLTPYGDPLANDCVEKGQHHPEGRILYRVGNR